MPLRSILSAALVLGGALALSSALRLNAAEEPAPKEDPAPKEEAAPAPKEGPDGAPAEADPGEKPAKEDPGEKPGKGAAAEDDDADDAKVEAPKEPRIFLLEDGSIKEIIDRTPRARRPRKGEEPALPAAPQLEERIIAKPVEPPPDAEPLSDPVTGAPYEGYGILPTGGEGGKEVWVTNLNGSGEGSLAGALAANKENAIIKFKVGGKIRLGGEIKIQGKNLTIAGETAPEPGITIEGGGASALAVKGENLIFRHLRLRNAPSGLMIMSGNRILVDHCSSGWMGSGAGAIKINSGRYITISWNILSGSVEAMRSHGVYASVHHNYWVHNNRRNPKIMGPGAVFYDYRNNVVIHWHNYGVRMEGNSTGNIVNNYFGPTANPNRTFKQALEYNPTAGPWYIAGNLADGGDVNVLSKVDKPFAEPKVTTVPADQLLALLREKCGPRPLDGWDQGYLNDSKDGVRSE